MRAKADKWRESSRLDAIARNRLLWVALRTGIYILSGEFRLGQDVLFYLYTNDIHNLF